MENKTYIQDKNGNRYFFDINTDTSKNSSAEIADSPIDARKGATLQDKRVVNMKTVGISGKYSSLCSNNSSFKVAENRLGIIISYFRNACKKQQIYTVCKKGALYENMMLEKVSLKFGEHLSTVEVSLSFIEVNIIDTFQLDTFKIKTEKEMFDLAKSLSLNYTTMNGYYALKLSSPRLSGTYNYDYVFILITNPNKRFDLTAVLDVSYYKDNKRMSFQITREVGKGNSVSIAKTIGANAINIQILCYFESTNYEDKHYAVKILSSDTTRLNLALSEIEESSTS